MVLKLIPLVVGNLTRTKLRSGLTLLSVVIAFVLFGVLAAAWHGFASGIRNGSSQLVVFNRTSRFHGLPLSDRSRIADIPGVRRTSYIIWFGGYFRDARNQLSGFAVDTATYFDLDPRLHVPAEQLARWKDDRTGVIVGAELARRYGWKIGDQIPVRNTEWQPPGGSDAWMFNIDGIASSTIAGQSADAFLLHYQYLNQSVPPRFRNLVSAFLVSIASPQQAALISSEIDDRFANSSAPTKTSTTQAVARGFADQFANLGQIVMAIGSAVFIGLLLIIGNVHAQAVSERTTEFATLRAIGYPNHGVLWIVTAEAVLTMLSGAVGGLIIAKLMTRPLAAAVQAFLPGFYLSGMGMALGLLLALTMALLASAIPDLQVARLQIAPALRGR